MGVLVFALLYWMGNSLVGYRCISGWASPSIGTRGTCSYHGGVNYFPHILVFIFSLIVSFLFASWLNFILKERTKKR